MMPPLKLVFLLSLLLSLSAVPSPGQTVLIAAGHLATSTQPPVPGYLNDTYFTGGFPWVNAPGIGTGVWATARFGPDFGYSIPAAPGLYSVTVRAVEPNRTGPGQRTFTVAINGDTPSDPIDLCAGGPPCTVHHEFRYLALSSTGRIRVNFRAVTGSNAVVSAVELRPLPLWGLMYAPGSLFTRATAGLPVEPYVWLEGGPEWRTVQVGPVPASAGPVQPGQTRAVYKLESVVVGR